MFDHITLADGYAIEIALLIDVAERFGAAAIGQVDLGQRIHRNRPLSELTAQARTVLTAALERAAGHEGSLAALLAGSGRVPSGVAGELSPESGRRRAGRR